MTKHLFFRTILSAGAITATVASAGAFEPVEPGNLKADVKGIEVKLSWEWGNAGKAVCSESFESDEFPEPWSVRNTYDYDPSEGGNWMIYDFTDNLEQPLFHEGIRSALLLMASAYDEEQPATSHQDEWLIVKPGKEAVYLDFWYYLHPELYEVGGFQDFPDHYYVLISRDNGESWEELWDGRWDMGYVDDMQQASLFLGEPTDENTLVAFNAVSGAEESLYFLWSVDDVNFYTAEEAASRPLGIYRNSYAGDRKPADGMATHRKFVPSDNAKKMERKAPESEWLNNGNITFRVYLDDEIIADYLKSRTFTDYSTKDPGMHTYSVMAWSEAEDNEYDEAVIEVDIEDYSFPPARNLKASYTLQDNGKYSISATWEKPEGDFVPDHYNIYVNGKSIGWVDGGDLTAGQSGIFKGAYTFSVEACYTFPDGISEMIHSSIFPGTVATPADMVLTLRGTDVDIKWNAPSESDGIPAEYSVYRGTDLLAQGPDLLEYYDENVAEGNYTYSIHAIYPDGTVSLPVSASVTVGQPSTFSLPYSQTFENAHIPAGWRIDLVDSQKSVKDMYSWRLDNWFDSDFSPAEGLDGSFPCISGVAAGMNKLQSFVVSPMLGISENADPQVSFTKYFFEEKPGPSGAAQFILQASSDGGETWDDIADLTAMPNGECTVPLTDYKGRTLQLRWGFLSRMSGIAAFDNVTVSDRSGINGTISESPGMDIYTADGIPVASGISPDSDVSLPAGIYIIRSGGKTFKRIVR